MKLLFDLNVLLDVIQHREPHFTASAAVCAMAVRKDVAGFIPSHALTTVATVVRKHAGAAKESEVLDWFLGSFTIAPAGHSEMLRAKGLRLADFEDAVVVATAETVGCRWIVTRNVRDFRGSAIPAITPEEFLLGA